MSESNKKLSLHTASIIVTAKGVIEYSLVGQGKPILFVHGGHVNCGEPIFQKGLDDNKLCFITPSRPGYGNTPLTSLNKTPKQTADLYIALLDELKISKVIVIGISAGGLTALEIAANYPDRVESLVLMSALTKKWFNKTDGVYKGGKILFNPNVERYTWGFYRILFKFFPKFMAKVMFNSLSKSRPALLSPEEFREIKQLILHMNSGSGFNNDLDQNIKQEILSNIKCRTLILYSENDNSVDNSHPVNANEKIKDSKLVTFKNHWGHMLWIGKDYELILHELKRQIDL